MNLVQVIRVRLVCGFLVRQLGKSIVSLGAVKIMQSLSTWLPPRSAGRSVDLSILSLAGRQRPVKRTAPSPIRVVIIEDQGVVRKGVSMYLQTDGDITLVGEANDGETGVALVKELKPDVVLMDVRLPGMDGIAATSAIRRESPSTEIVALSTSMEAECILGMIRAGAIGYLSKNTKANELCQAIHGVAAGQVQLAPSVAELLIQEMRAPVADKLSPREVEVLQCLVNGKTNRGIGIELSIGEKTVKTHMSNIIAKMGVESRTQAALVGVQRALVTLDKRQLAS
jgi:NarL family two-component system response regulator LiaR